MSQFLCLLISSLCLGLFPQCCCQDCRRRRYHAKEESWDPLSQKNILFSRKISYRHSPNPALPSPRERFLDASESWDRQNSTNCIDMWSVIYFMCTLLFESNVFFWKINTCPMKGDHTIELFYILYKNYSTLFTFHLYRCEDKLIY